MVTILFYIFLFYIGFKIIYTVAGIAYEWIFKVKGKGFTLNLIASLLLFILHVTLPYQLYLRFRKRKVGSVMDELVRYNYLVAIAKDQTGNLVFGTLLNKFLITDDGYKFGDMDQTISSGLGVNEVIGTIKTPLGEKLVSILDKIEKDHCKISIDWRNVNTEELTPEQRYVLFEYRTSLNNK